MLGTVLQLGGGIFTYFVLDFLERQRSATSPQRHFRLIPALSFCKPLYGAVSWLSRYPETAAGADDSGPQFVFRDFSVEDFQQQLGDSVDGGNSYHFLTKFFRFEPGSVGSGLVLQAPKKLVVWLRHVATPAIFQLHECGFINPTKYPALFNTVLAMLAVSSARAATIHERYFNHGRKYLNCFCARQGLTAQGSEIFCRNSKIYLLPPQT